MNYDMNHDDAISQCKIEQLRYRELTMPPCHYTYVKVRGKHVRMLPKEGSRVWLTGQRLS